MTEHHDSALQRIADRGRPKGAPAVYEAAVDASRHPDYVGTDRQPGRRTSRLLLVAALALLVLLAGGVLHLAGGPSGVDVLASLTGRAEPDPFADFDPREVRKVREEAEAQPNSFTPERTILATLQFRRTCRHLSRAVEAARASTDTTRAAAVHAVLDPELERAEASESNHWTLTEHYRELADQIASADYTDTNTWLERDCSGSDALTGGYVDQ